MLIFVIIKPPVFSFISFMLINIKVFAPNVSNSYNGQPPTVPGPDAAAYKLKCIYQLFHWLPPLLAVSK